MYRPIIFDDEEYIKVVDYFNTHNDNRTSVIARKLGYKEARTNYYIDVYLSLKKNYNGSYVPPAASNFNYKNKENTHKQNKNTIVCYEKDVYLGSFDSITSATNYLKVKREAVYGKLKDTNIITIVHRKPRRIITYKLIKN